MISTWNGMKIAKAIRPPGGDIVVYLIDSDESRNAVFDNIVAVKGRDLIWKLHPPGVPDYWIDMAYDGSFITASSFSCWTFEVDLLTGEVISTSFSK